VEEQEYIVPAGDGRVSLELAAPTPGMYTLRLHSQAADKSQTWRLTVRCSQPSRFSGATAEFALDEQADGRPRGPTFKPESTIEMCTPGNLYGIAYFAQGPATNAEVRWYQDGELLGSDPVRLERDNAYVSYSLLDVEPGNYTLQLVVASTNEQLSWRIFVRCSSGPRPTPTPEPWPVTKVRFGTGEYDPRGTRIDSGGEPEGCGASAIYADVDTIGTGVGLTIEWLHGSTQVYENHYRADEPGFYSPLEDPEPGVYTYRLTLDETGDSRSWTLRVRC
jgi:hypothetical protein